MSRRPALLWVVAMAFLLACAVVRGGSADTRPPSSPRTFVLPPSCGGETPCPGGYWVFRPPDCRDGGLSHPPGTVVRFEDETTCSAVAASRGCGRSRANRPPSR